MSWLQLDHHKDPYGMSAEEEDRLDFGEDDDDRESEISLGLGGEEADEGDPAVERAEEEHRQPNVAEQAAETSAAGASSSAAPAFDQWSTDDGRPLPEGWIRKVSSSTRETYFLNLKTRKSTWDEPKEPARGTPPPAAQGDGEKPASIGEEAKSAARSNGDGASYASVAAANAPDSAGTAEQAARSDADTAMDEDKDTCEASNASDPAGPGSAASGWKRGPQPSQSQVYRGSAASKPISDIAQLAQSAIAAPPQGPSAAKGSRDRPRPTRAERRIASSTAEAARKDDRKDGTSAAKAAEVPSTKSTPVIEPGIPTGPKADRDRQAGQRSARPAAVQTSRTDLSTSGPPTAPAALPSIPSGPRSNANPPGTAPLPRTSRKSDRIDRGKPSLDQGWPKRSSASTQEGTVGPAPSPAGSPERLGRVNHRDAALPDGPRETRPPRSEVPSARPATIKSRDSGWGKKAAEIEEAATTKAAEKDTTMRSVSPPPPRPTRWGPAKNVEAASNPAPDARASEKASDRRSDRPRTGTPPPRQRRRRSPSPQPMRKWGVPAPDTAKNVNESTSTQSHNNDKSSRSEEQRRQRSRTPPAHRPEKRVAPSDRDGRDTQTLMSRLEGRGKDLDAPPAKRSKPAEHDDSRMDIDASTPQQGAEPSDRPKGGISILGAGKSRGKRAAEAPRRPTPAAKEGDAPIVDITADLSIDDSALTGTQGKGEPVLRLFNPDKGTSTDSRAYMAHLSKKNIGESSRQDGQEREQKASTGSRASPLIAAGIAGLPPRPQVTEDAYRGGRNLSEHNGRGGSSHPEIDSYRPGNPRKDSRDSYRPGPAGGRRRSRSRSPPRSRWGRRSPSPGRDRRRP